MWYNKSIEETLNSLGSSPLNVLSSEEVSQRLAKFGPNMLAEQKTKSIIGRIFDQLNDVMIYILLAAAVILGEIIALFIAILLGWPAPLRPIHLLWVNLITDSFPALALGSDPGDPDVIKEKPRNPNENLF